jgi:hypothetical protein
MTEKTNPTPDERSFLAKAGSAAAAGAGAAGRGIKWLAPRAGALAKATASGAKKTASGLGSLAGKVAGKIKAARSKGDDPSA